MTVNILGTRYKLIIKKYDDDETFARCSICGYHDGHAKRIVICDMHTYKGWGYEEEDTIIAAQKETTRHEIVHAFLFESGLDCSSASNEIAWAKNEEMVDWVALQTPKMFDVFKKVGCI